MSPVSRTHISFFSDRGDGGAANLTDCYTALLSVFGIGLANRLRTTPNFRLLSVADAGDDLDGKVKTTCVQSCRWRAPAGSVGRSVAAVRWVFSASKLNSVDLSHSANMFRASKLKSVDFYRKTPKDLTEGSVLGAILSLMVLFAIVVLFGKELNAYLLVNKSTQVTVDKGIDGELLHINFDISFPSLSCEFASVDVSDVLGTKSFNITKSVHKYSIDANLNSTGSKFYSGRLPRIQNHEDEEEFDGYYSLSLTAENFDKYSRLRDILVVNFYAPWCQRSNKLKPSWEKAAKILRERYDPKWSGVLMARVDCIQEAELCRRHHITGYPTIRVFRRGSNATENNGHFEHDTYYGSHDTETLVNTMETLVESVPREAQTITDIMTMNRLNRHPAPLADGCRIKGWVKAKRIPGNLVFSASSAVHSFDPSQINVSHVISHFSFGKTFSPDAYNELKRLTPYLGASHDRLSGQSYIISESPNFDDYITIQHYLQLVKTELHFQNKKILDEYEYTAHSSTIMSNDFPAAKFHFDPSAMQVVVTEEPKSFSHFITNTCAIIGGIFTVGGMLQGILHKTFGRKIELAR